MDAEMDKGRAESQTSELSPKYIWGIRISLALASGLLLSVQYAAYRLVVADCIPNKTFSCVLVVLAEMLFGGLFLFSWNTWKRLPYRSMTFDSDGLWLTHVGKERGLVSWSSIRRIKEASFNNRLSLLGSNGKVLFVVEYERSAFHQLRALMLEKMAFQAPRLPVTYRVGLGPRIFMACMACTFAGGAALFLLFEPTKRGLTAVLPLHVIGRYVLAPLFLVWAALFLWIALARNETVVGREEVMVGSRRYPYADIKSVGMKFFNYRGVMSPRVEIAFTTATRRPVSLVPRGSDSLTFQRTLLWALDQWRQANSRQTAPSKE
jgi:hypothetical protein